MALSVHAIIYLAILVPRECVESHHIDQRLCYLFPVDIVCNFSIIPVTGHVGLVPWPKGELQINCLDHLGYYVLRVSVGLVGFKKNPVWCPEF